jgi:hypothetical protein
MPVAAPFPEIELHVHLEGRCGRQIVVAYAEDAAAHGAVYLEGIFTPVERVAGGASWAEVMNGFCDGAREAEERTDVIVRLTPDIPRGCDIERRWKPLATPWRSATAASTVSVWAASRPSSRPSPTSRRSRSRRTAAWDRCPSW